MQLHLCQVLGRKKYIEPFLLEQHPLETCWSLKDELFRLRGDISDPGKGNWQSEDPEIGGER